MESVVSQALVLLHIQRLSSNQKELLLERLDLIKKKKLVQEFWTLAEMNTAWIGCYKKLKSLRLNELIDPKWESKIHSFNERSQKKEIWLKKILTECNDKNIKIIPLKGGLFGPAIYNDWAYKKMNDFDFIIERNKINVFLNILTDLSFDTVKKETINQNKHHLVPYFSKDLSCVLGIHFNIHRSGGSYQINEKEIWEDVIPIETSLGQMYRMAWEKHLVHLCTHLPFYKVGIRELADFINLIRHPNIKMDWDLLIDVARKWKATGATYRLLYLCNKLVDFADLPFVPDWVLETLKLSTSYKLQKEATKRGAFGSQMLYFRSVHVGRIEKLFSVSVLSRNYKERVYAWWGTWKETFFADRNEVKKFFCIQIEEGKFNSFFNRIRFPFLVIKQIGEDHGYIQFFILTFLNIYLVLKWSLRELAGLNPKVSEESLRITQLINYLE